MLNGFPNECLSETKTIHGHNCDCLLLVLTRKVNICSQVFKLGKFFFEALHTANLFKRGLS